MFTIKLPLMIISQTKKNFPSILNALYKKKSLSINDISTTLNKSISLVTKNILEMLEEGSVEESGQAESRGGRKPTLYQLRSDLGYIIVLSMDQYISRVMVMDMNNTLMSPPIVYNINLVKEENTAQKILELLTKTIQDSGIEKDKILGVGIAMPGFIDFVNGVNHSYIPSPIENIPIRDYLSTALGLPVYIDNDSSVIALAESTFGLAKNTCNAMVVNISWVIGLGIVTNGKLYRGENGFAGEFSHIPLFNNDKICSCGKIGCLETETSLRIVMNKAKEAISSGRPTILANTFTENDTLEEQFLKFIQAVEKGDMLAIELLNQAAYNIGKGIAILIHIFNPKKIILSGRGAMAGNVWLPPIQQAINEHCIKRLSDGIEIVVSKMNIEAEWIGTAALVVENTFRSSVV